MLNISSDIGAWLRSAFAVALASFLASAAANANPIVCKLCGSTSISIRHWPHEHAIVRCGRCGDKYATLGQMRDRLATAEKRPRQRFDNDNYRVPLEW
ncbi:MAG TPA: hypothetical protein VGN82_08125 [Bosea sp. (in: a-proteobacteria)]|jgi:hypothetical protein|uniref:hypothetical protein n=1 Tax=Bosea sp. (in: a-proteobacteria) TaxID=1871050 RepID=UPI002E1550A0|nr:hypothetical protein [Bosea sp. (in: a-proteobacteria)]